MRFIGAVAQLAGDAEAVGLETSHRFGVARRRRAVEQVEGHGFMFEPVAQQVNHAAFGDLALQACQKLLPLRAVVVKV